MQISSQLTAHSQSNTSNQSPGGQIVFKCVNQSEEGTDEDELSLTLTGA